MAVLKCKMCGANLEIEEAASVIECEYCGSRNTLPKLNDEKKAALFDRANFYRAKNEFDRAELIYENIAAEAPDEPEAYWGICLCRYGIEYVVDPKSGNRVPTCHRTQFKSILEDNDYKKACANADVIAKAVYKEEAQYIENIQKDILKISSKEEPFDIFICYKQTDEETGERTVDSLIAEEIYNELVEKGYKVFFSMITLEDKLGKAYEPYIFSALNSAKVMLVVGTNTEHLNAVWVKNEWGRYLKLIEQGHKKSIIPCYRDMTPYELPEQFVALQAQDVSKVGWKQDLIRGIDKLFCKETRKKVIQNETNEQKVIELEKRGYDFMKLGKWETAEQTFYQLTDEYPGNYQGWWGLIKSTTKEFTEVYEDSQQIGEWFNNVKLMADDNIVSELEKEYIVYVLYEAQISKNRIENQISENLEVIENQLIEYQNTIESLRIKKKNMIENFKNIIARFDRKIVEAKEDETIKTRDLTKYDEEKSEGSTKKGLWYLSGVVLLIVAVITVFTSNNLFHVQFLIGLVIGFVAFYVLSHASDKGFDENGNIKRQRERAIKEANENLKLYTNSKQNRVKRESEWVKEYERKENIFAEAIEFNKKIHNKIKEYFEYEDKKRFLAWAHFYCVKLCTSRSVLDSNSEKIDITLEEAIRIGDLYDEIADDISNIRKQYNLNVYRGETIVNNIDKNVWIESVESSCSRYGDGSGGVYCDNINLEKNLVVRFNIFLKQPFNKEDIRGKYIIKNYLGEVILEKPLIFYSKPGIDIYQLYINIALRNQKTGNVILKRGEYYAEFYIGEKDVLEYCFKII